MPLVDEIGRYSGPDGPPEYRLMHKEKIYGEDFARIFAWGDPADLVANHAKKITGRRLGEPHWSDDAFDLFFRLWALDTCYQFCYTLKEKPKNEEEFKQLLEDNEDLFVALFLL